MRAIKRGKSGIQCLFPSYSRAFEAFGAQIAAGKAFARPDEGIVAAGLARTRLGPQYFAVGRA